MAIEINTAQLVSAFKVMRSLIDSVSRHRLRELDSHFYFSFNERELVITSSMCNEATLSILIPYQKEVILPESEHFLVPRPICSMVKAIQREDEEKITFRLDRDKQLLVLGYSTGLYKIYCYTLSQRDFDVRRFITDNTIQTAKVDAGTIAKGIRYTSGFCSNTELNITNIKGYIHLDIQNGHVELVGTNGKELAHYKAETAESQSLSCNIYSKFGNVLQLLMRYGLETVSTDGSSILFKSSTYQFVCPTSRVPYPNYRRILQIFETGVTCATIPTQDMVHAVALVNSKEADTTLVTVKVTEKSVHVTGVDLKKSAKASETIHHTHTDGSFTFSVYGSLLAKALRMVSGDELTISFVGKNRPILISSDDKNLSVVLLPTESLLKE